MNPNDVSITPSCDKEGLFRKGGGGFKGHASPCVVFSVGETIRVDTRVMFFFLRMFLGVTIRGVSYNRTQTQKILSHLPYNMNFLR